MYTEKEKIVSLILRIGVAFAFIYAAISGFINPYNWIGYFPPFLQDIIPGGTLITLWGIFEIILGAWILSGKRIFIPSVIASLSLAGLILTNFSQIDVLFRDVSILAVTVALAVWNYKR